MLSATQIPFTTTHPLNIARTQVSLPSGSFIRALPFVVDETQRFRMDALVVCADILASAYVQIIELALMSKLEVALGEEPRSRHLDVAMFQHAWSMVDQVYSLRLLLKSLGFTGDDVNAFLAATERAYVLRNRMDHLVARIPNIAASDSQTRSLFGSLSYFVSGAAIGSPDVDAFLVTQQVEPVRAGEQIASVRMPAAMRLPLGNFTLSAAGEMLDLDAAILTLGPVMIRTNDGFESSIRAQVNESAAQYGVDQSALLAHYGARYKVMLAIHTGQPPEESKPAKAYQAEWPTLGVGPR